MKMKLKRTLESSLPIWLYAAIRDSYLYSQFVVAFLRFRQLNKKTNGRFIALWRYRYPCIHDSTTKTGFDAHYVYHPAWAARILAQTRPSVHIDISSTLYFSATVSAFIPVRFLDFRPADIHLNNLVSERGDLMQLPFESGSVSSISCMHVVEHIGLGRYGEPLDPEGDLKAIREIQRVVALGGSLLFVTPVGKPRIQFNAHRVYAYQQIIGYFSSLKLKEFSLVPDKHDGIGIVNNATEELADQQNYGCGCFWFVKEE